MKKYHLINNIIGWAVFVVASVVYILTAEATASWWDCGEYIAPAMKLQVGPHIQKQIYKLPSCLKICGIGFYFMFKIFYLCLLHNNYNFCSKINFYPL